MLGEGLVSEHKPRWAAFGSTSRTPKNHIPRTSLEGPSCP